MCTPPILTEMRKCTSRSSPTGRPTKTSSSIPPKEGWISKRSPKRPPEKFIKKSWIRRRDSSLSRVEKSLSIWGWKERLSKRDRKSTRLNSSHVAISYAVFCLKKKKKKTEHQSA